MSVVIVNSSESSRHKYGLLAKVTEGELTQIRVAVKRKDVTSKQPILLGPLIREIDDPKSIVPLVHVIKCNVPPILKSIFDRDGVLVNQSDRPSLPETETLSQASSRSNLRGPTHYCKTRTKSRSRSLSTDRTEYVIRFDKRSYNRISSPRNRSTDRELRRRTSKSRSRDRGIPRRSSDRRRSVSRDSFTHRSIKDSSRRIRDRSLDRGHSPKRSIDRYSSRRESEDESSPRNRHSPRYAYKESSIRGKITEPGISKQRSTSRSRSPIRRNNNSPQNIRGGSPSKYARSSPREHRARSRSRGKDRSPRRKTYTSRSLSTDITEDVTRFDKRSYSRISSPKNRSTDRELRISKSRSRDRTPRRSSDRRRSVSRDSCIHRSIKDSSRRIRDRSLDQRKTEDRIRRSTSRSSLDRGRSPRRSIDRYSSRRESKDESSPRNRLSPRYVCKGCCRVRDRSNTPLRPGEYIPNHPNLKRKLEREKDRKGNRQEGNRSSRSRSPSAGRSRRHRKSPSRDEKRSSSRSSPPSDLSHFEASDVYYGNYGGIPPQEYWIHPGLIRPGYPVPRCHPPHPGYFPRGMPPIIYPPRYPLMPHLVRSRFRYNNPQKPETSGTVPGEESTTGANESTATSNSDAAAAREGILAIEAGTSEETLVTRI